MALQHKRAPRQGLKSYKGRTSMHEGLQVMRTNNALDLEPGVFTLEDPRQIALSLKRSAEAYTRRKACPYCTCGATALSRALRPLLRC